MLVLLVIFVYSMLSVFASDETILKRIENVEDILRMQQSTIQKQDYLIRDLRMQLVRQNYAYRRLEADKETMGMTNNSDLSSERSKRQSITNVAFSASLPLVLRGSEHHHVQYNRKVFDNTGSFNPTDGTFVAPVTGTYVFTWSAASYYQSTELVVNGVPYAFLMVDSEDGQDYGTGAQTVVLQVTKGQHVWIRLGKKGDWRLEGENYNTFSGWLLLPE